MNCPQCDKELILKSIFDGEEIGKESGICRFYCCTCGVSVEVFIPVKKVLH